MDGGGALQIYGDEYRIFRYRSVRPDWNGVADYSDWFLGLLLYREGPTSSSIRSKF
jgi:hypothetical protein